MALSPSVVSLLWFVDAKLPQDIQIITRPAYKESQHQVMNVADEGIQILSAIRGVHRQMGHPVQVEELDNFNNGIDHGRIKS